MGKALAQRGLLKLMLKLPAVRGRLQVLIAHDGSVESLCEAYEEASTALDRFRSSSREADRKMADEYETICVEIESDIIQSCLRTPFPVLK